MSKETNNMPSKKEQELIREAFVSLTKAPRNLHLHGLNNPNQEAIEPHRGTVEDPEHDGRLSENKEKEDEESRRKEKEQEEAEQKEKEKRNIKKKLNKVKRRHDEISGFASLNYSNEESILRNHFTYGAAINQILGVKANLSSLQKVRASLVKQEASSKSIADSNEIHQLLSHVASLMIKSGALNK